MQNLTGNCNLFSFKNAFWQSSWELKLANLEPILASQKRHSCIFYARSACTAWVVLGWVAWVTVFVWGLKGGLFGWEWVGELFATHADFKLNLQQQKKQYGPRRAHEALTIMTKPNN